MNRVKPKEIEGIIKVYADGIDQFKQKNYEKRLLLTLKKPLVIMQNKSQGK